MGVSRLLGNEKTKFYHRFLNGLILVAQFWTGFAPIGYGSLSSTERIKNFFEVYLAAPIVIVMYVGFKVWKRTSVLRTSEIDITSGRRELDLARILAEERAVQAMWPWWKKVWKTLC